MAVRCSGVKQVEYGRAGEMEEEGAEEVRDDHQKSVFSPADVGALP